MNIIEMQTIQLLFQLRLTADKLQKQQHLTHKKNWTKDKQEQIEKKVKFKEGKMYTFRDINEVSEVTSLPSEALQVE